MSDSEPESVEEEYKRVWVEFIKGVHHVHKRLRVDTAGQETPLHDALRKVRDVPYQLARTLLNEPKVHVNPGNIGSVTGFFFEQTVVALIVPSVVAALPDVHIRRNACDRRERKLPRDPDLYFSNGDREVVFEMKASPKKGDLEHVRKRVQPSYNAAGIRYFLVGGYASAHGSLLGDLAREGWVTIADVSARNRSLLSPMPSLDDLVRRAVAFLRAA